MVEVDDWVLLHSGWIPSFGDYMEPSIKKKGQFITPGDAPIRFQQVYLHAASSDNGVQRLLTLATEWTCPSGGCNVTPIEITYFSGDVNSARFETYGLQVGSNWNEMHSWQGGRFIVREDQIHCAKAYETCGGQEDNWRLGMFGRVWVRLGTSIPTEDDLPGPAPIVITTSGIPGPLAWHINVKLTSMVGVDDWVLLHSGWIPSCGDTVEPSIKSFGQFTTRSDAPIRFQQVYLHGASSDNGVQRLLTLATEWTCPNGGVSFKNEMSDKVTPIEITYFSGDVNSKRFDTYTFWGRSSNWNEMHHWHGSRFIVRKNQIHCAVSYETCGGQEDNQRLGMFGRVWVRLGTSIPTEADLPGPAQIVLTLARAYSDSSVLFCHNLNGEQVATADLQRTTQIDDVKRELSEILGAPARRIKIASSDGSLLPEDGNLEQILAGHF